MKILNKKSLLTSATISSILFLVLFVFLQAFSLQGFSDACAVVGIAFLAATFFLIAKYLKFFDLFSYSFGRFARIRKKSASTDFPSSFNKYQKEKNHTKVFIETGVVALIWIVFSIISALLLSK